jgi:hypothetical protein
MEIHIGTLGQFYHYRNQRFTENEAAIVKLAVEARWSDARIARVLGRPERSIRSHRRTRGILKQRGRGLWYALAIVLASAFDSPAIAHDPGEPYAEWYQSLDRPDVGGPCCSQHKDCQPVEYRMSPPVQETDSDYEAMVAGHWLRVPQRALLARHDNPTGGGVLCKASGSDYIYCFVPSDSY